MLLIRVTHQYYSSVLLMKRLYFDWNASAPVRPEVIERVQEVQKWSANPSSIHFEGRRSRSIIEEARARIRSLLKADRYRVVFTSGATESNNLAIFGFERNCINRGLSPSFISSRIEHSSVLAPIRYLEHRGNRVEWLSNTSIRNHGVESFHNLVGTSIFNSVMLSNSETGHLFELPASKATEAIHYHCDAAQVVGRIPFYINNSCLDTVTLSSHKIGGPTGVGALLVRDESTLSSIQLGGAQEYSLRAGTENVASIAGFALATEIAVSELDINRKHLLNLNALLRTQIAEHIPDTKILTPPDYFLPNTVSALFPALDGRSLVVALDLEGVAASVGSACASGSIEPSHVLLALGFTADEARSAVRLSFGCSTTESDVLSVVQRLSSVVKRLRH